MNLEDGGEKTIFNLKPETFPSLPNKRSKTIVKSVTQSLVSGAKKHSLHIHFPQEIVLIAAEKHQQYRVKV
jgi:hypothetical protein